MLKKITILIVFIFTFSAITFAQIKINEGFETSDSDHLPIGWSKFNAASFPIYYSPIYSNWTVRDSGVWMPGLASAFTNVHSGIKSCGVSWYMGFDTAGGYHIAAGWLVTKKITNIQTTDIIRFWGSGGSPTYGDSIQIWVNFIDSTPTNFTNQLASIYWPNGTTYGTWTQYQYSLAPFAGFPFLYVGFLYNTNQLASNNGFAVYLDDVFAGNPNSINQIGTGVPTVFELGQNYPNPFNPVTNIKFDLPKSSNVKITIYNNLVQEIAIILNESKSAGFYEVKYDASSLSSGVYFYRIEAGTFVQTKKMMVLK